MSIWNRMPAELQGEIRGTMDIRQLVNLSQTDHANHNECTGVLYQRVKQEISGVALDADATLERMKELGIIISGSVTIHALIGHTFEAGDIDFFGKSEGAKVFHQWVIETTGYRDVTTQRRKEIKDVEGSGSQYVNGSRDLWDVKWLEHDSGWKMNIISTGQEDPMIRILDFDSSLVMNVITYAGVGCAFPAITCEKIGVWFYQEHLVHTPKGQRVKKRAEKYQGRGFRVIKHADWVKEAPDGRTDIWDPEIWNPLTRGKPSILWLSYPQYPNSEAKEVVPSSFKVHYDWPYQ